MKITDIRVFREPLELTRPYTIAYKTVSEVENIFVELHTDTGHSGIGAANPSPYVVGESLDDSEAALDDALADRLIGTEVPAREAWGKALLALLPDRPGARAALDIALHDLYAQAAGLPLADALGRAHQQMPTSITIGIKDTAATLAEAEEYLGRGFRHLKVKLGHSLEEDLDRLHKLRERFGQDVNLRVDANQGYTPAQLALFLEATARLRLELIEQPLPPERFAGLRELPPAQRALIAADESLVSAEDAWQLLSPQPACGIFNLKLMKSGGIYQALRIADLAAHAGVALMWGCNDESIVSISAALHAAFSCPHTRYLDLDGSLDLARDLRSGGFVLEQGMMRTKGLPGLGLDPA
jgi:L-alanine-DL-glutamate epimerase-like enolase superfamily enzyme